MKGDYPRFRTSYSHDELVEHFLLTPAEQRLIAQCRGDVNCHGVAILLTSLRYLGYFPGTPQEVPTDVKTFLARQLNLLWEPSEGSGHFHVKIYSKPEASVIRQHTAKK